MPRRTEAGPESDELLAAVRKDLPTPPEARNFGRRTPSGPTITTASSFTVICVPPVIADAYAASSVETVHAGYCLRQPDIGAAGSAE
jgi:hypothetical protein